MKTINKISKFFVEWFTPAPYFSEFAEKHPNEFEEIITALKFDVFVEWLSKRLK